MPNLFLRYPDGIAGFALLLMRLSYALLVFPSLTHLWPTTGNWWVMGILSSAIVLALVIGFGTRAAALLLAVTLVADLFAGAGEAPLQLITSAGGVGALMLLGPGAYSVDARRFGRRVIRLEPQSPDRGSTG